MEGKTGEIDAMKDKIQDHQKELNTHQKGISDEYIKELKTMGEKGIHDVKENIVDNRQGAQVESEKQAATEKVKKALETYNDPDVSDAEKVVQIRDAMKMIQYPSVEANLKTQIKNAIKTLEEKNKQTGGGKKTESDKKTAPNVLEQVLVKTNEKLEEHVEQTKKQDHPMFPEYSLVLTRKELDKTGMFYTHCYEEDKLCKDKLKKLFEDVLKSFENKEQRDKEEKLRPKHFLHQRRIAQINVVFESLSTKEEQIVMNDIMLDLFTALKEDKPKEYIIGLLNKGIKTGSKIGIKLLHTYQAVFNIDIKGKLTPSDEKEYLDTMMGIIFCPMCPFIELAKMLKLNEKNLQKLLL